jgi:hypothetical protein
MFLSELSPIFKELLQQPIAFSGGFFSGLLRLNPNEEPLASWLNKQGYTSSNLDDNQNNGSDGPHSISID